MPKMKSHRYRNHILTKKSTKAKRNLRTSCTRLKPCDARLAERMLNGG